MVTVNSLNFKLDKIKQDLVNKDKPLDIMVFVNKEGAKIGLHYGNRINKTIETNNYEEYEKILYEQYADVEKIIFIQPVEH